MSTTKISTTLDERRVAEAKARVGDRGFSRYLDAALARQLQHDRLTDLETDLTNQFGAIPAEVQHEIDALEWPG